MKNEISYEVEVTKDNVVGWIVQERYRLMEAYGPRLEKDLEGLMVGPNSYKCLEVWGQECCFINTLKQKDGIYINGLKIFCGVLPLIVPVFKASGWHLAHLEAKRFMGKLNIGE